MCSEIDQTSWVTLVSIMNTIVPREIKKQILDLAFVMKGKEEWDNNISRVNREFMYVWTKYVAFHTTVFNDKCTPWPAVLLRSEIQRKLLWEPTLYHALKTDFRGHENANSRKTAQGPKKRSMGVVQAVPGTVRVGKKNRKSKSSD